MRYYLVFFISLLFFSSDLAGRDIGWLAGSDDKEAFPLVTFKGDASLCYDNNEPEAVVRAIGDLLTDIQRVTGRTLRVQPGKVPGKRPVLIGTVGYSAFLDQLEASGKLSLDSLRGKWECSIAKVIKNPMPGVDEALVLAGSDRRGTIYAIYELSRQLGVSPWHWWADAPVAKRDEVFICSSLNYYSGEPAVKYRGIFINDEFPAMTGWARERFGGMNSSMYAHVYELLLRLRANCMWPAMWGSFKEYKPMVPIFRDENGLYEGNCFNEDDPLNPAVADAYGIVIGTSHHEPMQRSQQEWIRNKHKYGNGQWNYLTNREGLQRFFRDGMSNVKNYESLVTIGMRGDEDKPMEDAGGVEANFRLLRKIINDQRRIIKEETGKPASATPQVWTLYSEVLDYYDLGMPVPDDVILMFADDNYGNVRRLPELGKPRHKGGYGMYYHVGYYGAPRAAKWLSYYQVEQLWEQLQVTYDYCVDKLWILNVGDIKPHEYLIDFYMEMAWNPHRYAAHNLQDYTREFCASLFGEDHADEAAAVLSKYAKYSARITGELLNDRTYNLETGEFLAVRNEFLALEAYATRLLSQLPAEAHDCYREIILFPVQAMANLYDMYYGVAMNRKLADEKDQEANYWADHVMCCFKRDSMLCSQYNHEIAGGKWNHMMDQVHIGYTTWNAPERNAAPKVLHLESGTSMGKYVFRPENGVVVMEAEHFYSAASPQRVRWTVIPDYGRTRSGIALMPYTLSPRGGSLSYRIEEVGTLDSVQVRLIFKSTMPFTGKEGHNVRVGFAGAEPVEINLNKDMTWANQYSLMYPTGSSRINEKVLTLPVSGHNGVWELKVEPLDPGIVLHKIVVDLGGYRRSHLHMNESPYRREK